MGTRRNSGMVEVRLDPDSSHSEYQIVRFPNSNRIWADSSLEHAHGRGFTIFDEYDAIARQIKD